MNISESYRLCGAMIKQGLKDLYYGNDNDKRGAIAFFLLSGFLELLHLELHTLMKEYEMINNIPKSKSLLETDLKSVLGGY